MIVDDGFHIPPKAYVELRALPTHAQSETILQRSADDFITTVGNLFVEIIVHVRTQSERVLQVLRMADTHRNH